MRGERIKERTCPACDGTGYPVVKQPALGRRIYPAKCKSCDGKGKVMDAIEDPETIRRLVELGLKAKGK
jgi:DnaJ-class molecular chaperone